LRISILRTPSLLRPIGGSSKKKGKGGGRKGKKKKRFDGINGEIGKGLDNRSRRGSCSSLKGDREETARRVEVG